MLSPLAKEDLQDLRDEGLQPTDEDVVRLNALALRLTDGPETTAACAPRFAVAGGITFWEPTCAAWEWYRYASDFAEDGETDGLIFAFACANGREPKMLERLRERDDINSALGMFLMRVTATRDEIARAVRFVTYGYDDEEPEKSDLAKDAESKKSQEELETERFSVIEDRIRKAAASTGLSIDEIFAQTPSRLLGMIEESYVRAGMSLARTTAKAHAEYLATLHVIRKRLISARTDPDAARAN